MTKEAFLAFCGAELGTEPDYPFDEDFEMAVLRHKGSRKWFAVVMKVSRRKFGIDSDEAVDIVNLKIPLEMFGFFGKEQGVYPAYHMNKLHWVSVLLSDTADSTVEFLANVSYEETKTIPRRRKNESGRNL